MQVMWDAKKVLERGFQWNITHVRFSEIEGLEKKNQTED